MIKQQFILSIDQGTSSTKCIIIDEKGQTLAQGSASLHTSYLENGFVEQAPEAIYESVLDSVRKTFDHFASLGYNKNDITSIGISNQRETFLVWDKDGKPLYNAIVWQCKRSVEICDQLKRDGLSDLIRQKTGLVTDPYFSATKLIWLNQHNATVKEAISAGECYFGTVDTWLLYNLTGKKEYATDHTNASRTLFFNLHTLQWDHELITAFGLKDLRLPRLAPSSSHFGETTINGLLDRPVEITGMIGDSHAAAFGEGCFDTGTAKATLGTGCSVLMNIGQKPVVSENGMVTTICWSIEGRVDYALEGVIVSCGATIEWLKTSLGLFDDSRETEKMARAVADNGRVYFIPAFSGLGSPHWKMDQRASITGMTFGTTKNHIVRAALESIPYQVKDVIAAMEKDAGISLKQLMANGGITANGFVMQFIADILNKNVVSNDMSQVSALGAAYIAGLTGKIFADIDALKKIYIQNNIYQPGIDRSIVQNGYEEWKNGIKKALSGM